METETDYVITIKKYENRRLYNTDTSAYITLSDIAKLIEEDQNIVVIDAKTREDLTQMTLLQVVLEHQQAGDGPLPVDLLKMFIKLRGHTLKNPFVEYLSTCSCHFFNNMNKMPNPLSSDINPINFINPNSQLYKNNAAIARSMLKIMNTWLSRKG